jgi:hypothetical protein
MASSGIAPDSIRGVSTIFLANLAAVKTAAGKAGMLSK